MAQQKKQTYTMEIVFGSLVLVILLAILIPSFTGAPGKDQGAPSGTTQVEVDIPIEAHDPTLGVEEAPVTFVEFVDYQCPVCKESAEETLALLKEAYIDQGEVRYVLKDFPLTSHEHALPAAMAARAAGEQGEYWAMHDLIFAEQSEWTGLSSEELNAQWIVYAEELGLDVKQFEQDLESDVLKDRVVAARQLGDYNGITSTPTVIVNGKMYDGLITPDELRKVIDEAKK